MACSSWKISDESGNEIGRISGAINRRPDSMVREWNKREREAGRPGNDKATAYTRPRGANFKAGGYNPTDEAAELKDEMTRARIATAFAAIR